MEPHRLHWICNYMCGIAADGLRDLYASGKYRRRLDAVLEGSQQDVLDLQGTIA